MKKWIVAGLALVAHASLQADGPLPGSADAITPPQIDVARLREDLELGRRVGIKGLGGELSMSGEVRSEVQLTSETQAGIQRRGRKSADHMAPFASNDVEVNLTLRYDNEDSWAQVKMKFDNDQGIFGGTNNKLAISRATFGTQWLETPLFSLDTEVGRTSLGSYFDSKLQYGANLDGVAVAMQSSIDNVGELYCNIAPFVIDENFNRYGGAVELGMLEMFDTGFFSKLSFVDWNLSRSAVTPLEQMVHGYQNVQFTLGHQSTLPWFSLPFKAYLSGLMNVANNMGDASLADQNKGAYLGFSLGLLGKPNSFAFDVNYQWVQARAVSEFDAKCIGRGNVGKQGLYTTKMKGSGDILASLNEAVGTGNFHGVAVELVYQITQNIQCFQSFKRSTTLSTAIGPAMDYYQAEVEFIYAF